MSGSESRVRSAAFRYAWAGVALAAGLLARVILDPLIRERSPFSPIYVAVLISARYLGSGPSLLVLIAGGSVAMRMSGWSVWDRAIPFLVTGLLTIWIIDVLNRARNRATESARLADDRLARLRKEMEQSAHLRAVVDSSSDAIISKSLDGIIQTWNQGAQQIYGYTAAETIGKPVMMLVPPDRQHEESDIMERIRRGGRVKHFETMRRRKDGTEIQVSLTISPIRDESGVIRGISHVARDITEQKSFEEQFRQTQKLESLGVLAGGIAHDFNNLLTGIMGNASLALEDVDPQGRAYDRIREVLNASDRAALLIAQMLAYAGKGRIVMERLDLSVQVAEILPLIRNSIPRVVEIKPQLAPDLPPVEGDRAQLQQLVMNLVLNGAEAMGDGQGTVTITTFARQTESEHQVILQVSDTGSGMDEDTKTRIFDPFFSTKFTGRGLGLSAVVGIIRTHRGVVSVDSAPGQGSVFTVVLPAASVSPLTVEAKPVPAADTREEGKILVADDEELVRNMARAALEQSGYAVESAHDGKTAVEKFASCPDQFAAVLLDLTMPVMNGEDALKKIKAIRPDIPVVLSSGYNEVEAVSRFETSGLAGFLQKPYTATALAGKIRKALGSDPGRGAVL